MSKPIPPLPPEAAEALAKGRLLEAVKILRATTPMGLGEAKSVLEWHLRHNAMREPKASPRPAITPMVHRPHAGGHVPKPHVVGRPGLSPGEVPKNSGGGLGIIVMLAVAAGVAYYFLNA